MLRRAHGWIRATALLVGGCGQSTNTSSHIAVKVIRPDRALWCPTSKIAPGQSKANTRAVGSFDTRVLLGQAESRAAAESAQYGCLWRVVIRDGHGLHVTADAVPERVDAIITHRVVTEVGVY